MNNQNGTHQDTILNWIVIVSAVLLFTRTADLMAMFSPQILNNIIGFDISLIFGLITALLVEGMALVLHFHPNMHTNLAAQVSKWLMLAISGICQILDGYVSNGTASQMTDTLKFTLTTLVPNVPLLVIILGFAIGISQVSVPARAKKPFKGIKNLLPDFSKIWNGDNYIAPTPAIQTFASEVDQPELEEDKPELDEPKQAKLRQRK